MLLTWFTAAGASWGGTCSGLCYDDWVVGNGSVYNTAYFEVGYVRVFSSSGTNTVVSATTASSGSGSSATVSSTNSPISSTLSKSDAGLPHGNAWTFATVGLVVGLISSALF